MIITIDGPAGTGKTTVARNVASALKIPYFDTGALYRCVTWLALKKGTDLSKEDHIEELLKDFSFAIDRQEGISRYFVNKQEVTQEIRSSEVTRHVSAVSALKPVREKLLQFQHAAAEHEDMVFEGRDLGTVVFPQADLKIFLTATPEVRAKRRLKEVGKGDFATMLKEMERRDRVDSTRSLAPLSCPKDAYIIDTSALSIDQVVERIVKRFKKKCKKTRPAWSYLRGMTFLYRVVLFFAWLWFKIFYRHRVYGLEHFEKGGAILAANHTSFLDPPILAISWPEEVHFLARETLFKPLLFGWFIKSLHAHPVSGKASDVSVLKTVCMLLKEGKKVVLFPEGTRSVEGKLGPIKPGISLLLSRTDAAVIPAYIHGAFEVWGRKRKFPKVFGRTACVFGKPIYFKEFAALEKRAAQEALAARIATSIESLRSWYEEMRPR